MRLYLDFPGRPSALPRYLLDEGVRTRPMGGEIYPPLQSCVFEGPGSCEQQVGLVAQDLTEAVEITHATWLLARAVLDGDLHALLPGRTSLWTGTLDPPAATTSLLLRVVNPLEGGAALRFANAGQDTALPGHLTLGPPTG